jgi:GNAT superfamily N-acetyltransferase
MQTDMFVKLYNLPEEIPGLDRLKNEGIEIRRALPVDKHLIVSYIKDVFSDGWASECDVSFSNKPVSCFVAVKEKKIIGFACYNATCIGFFGPTGVSPDFRSKGVGKALLFKALLSMWEEGFAYAIIGWVDDALEFYKKTVNAVAIEDSAPGIYKRMVSY